MDALEVTFDVTCTPDRAFTLWTTRIDTWWPRAKSFSGAPASVHLEPQPGGRIYEVTPDGREHDWGRVAVADPPHRLAFTWHLMFPAAEATDVEVTFTAMPSGTRITLRHSGWDRLAAKVSAEAAQERRRRNAAGWAGIAEALSAAADA